MSARYYYEMDMHRQLAIKSGEAVGNSVIYVMSRDQRVADNHALLAAQSAAERDGSTLFVLFVLRKTGVRSREHYQFMLDGLRSVHRQLDALGIPLVLRIGEPETEIQKLAKEVNAVDLYFDFNPLGGVRKLVDRVAQSFHGNVTVVDTHNIIPAWVLSDKQEYAAHTMRTKVHKHLSDFLVAPGVLKPQITTVTEVRSVSFKEAEDWLQTIPLAGIKVGIMPGEAAAHARLKEFIDNGLETYAFARNDIANDQQSGLSPYLHFGQLSSLRVALEVLANLNETPLLYSRPKLAEHGDRPNRVEGMNALFEEMIVRKELSDNFCMHTDGPFEVSAAPAWALATLQAHVTDTRDFVYTKQQWESAATHDQAWNAAQKELTKTGKMHGYMRMYWAKKILEWSASPNEAIKTAIYLNDKYSIDGGDPNGYVGILWSIAGLHDRPWFERPVYGKIRYMNEAGLRRKFDLQAYIDKAITP